MGVLTSSIYRHDKILKIPTVEFEGAVNQCHTTVFFLPLKERTLFWVSSLSSNSSDSKTGLEEATIGQASPEGKIQIRCIDKFWLRRAGLSLEELGRVKLASGNEGGEAKARRQSLKDEEKLSS